MAENNEAHNEQVEHFERQSVSSSVDSPEKINSQAKILDYYRPKMMKSNPDIVLDRTVTAKPENCMQSLLDDVCKELDSIDIIVSQNKIIECIRPVDKPVRENEVKKIASSIPKCIRDTLSKSAPQKQTVNLDTEELADTDLPAVEDVDSSSISSIQINDGKGLLSAPIQESEIDLDLSVQTINCNSVNQESDINHSFLINAQTSSSFNVTDSADVFENAVGLQQSISIEVITEGIEDGYESPSQYQEDVSILVLNSAQKNALKKSTYMKSFSKSAENRTMKARRISAKMKSLWAKEIEKNGCLTCPNAGCSQTYVTVANLQTHYKWCTGKKNLQHCPFCDSLIISGPESVLHHMEVEHPEKVDEYKEKLGADQSHQHVQLAASSAAPPKSIFKTNGKKYQKLNKGRIFTSKENIFSSNKDLDFELKNIERTMNANFSEFQKCVKFNDIVQKINSVGDQPDFGETKVEVTLKKPPVLAKPLKETRLLQFDGSSPVEYFKDELVNVDCPSHLDEVDEQDFPPKRISTKSKVVLNTRGYERFSQYLKLTRDWASERQTYTRSKNPADSPNMSFEETALPHDVQDSYVLSEAPESMGMTISSLDSSQIATPPPIKKSIKKEKSSPAKQVLLKARLIERQNAQNANSTSLTENDESPLKQANNPPIHENSISECQDVNYGHLLFSKPNKKAMNKERTTCYDNAANLDTSHKPLSNHKPMSEYYGRNFKKSDMEGKNELSSPLPVVDFDTLLGASTPSSKGRPKKKASLQSDELANGTSPVMPQKPLKSAKYGKTVLQKYSREDGVKLPATNKKYQRDKKVNTDNHLASKGLLRLEGSHMNGRIDGTSLHSFSKLASDGCELNLKNITLDFIIKEIMSKSSDELPLFMEPFGSEYGYHTISNAVHVATNTDLPGWPSAEHFITSATKGDEQFLCSRFTNADNSSRSSNVKKFSYVHNLCESAINHVTSEVSRLATETACSENQLPKEFATSSTKNIVPIGLTASHCYNSWTLCVLLPELESESYKCFSIDNTTLNDKASKRGRPPKMVLELKTILQNDISANPESGLPSTPVIPQSVEVADVPKKGKKGRPKSSIKDGQAKLKLEEEKTSKICLPEDSGKQVDVLPVEESSSNTLQPNSDCNTGNLSTSENGAVSTGGGDVNKDNGNNVSDMCVTPEAPPPKRGRGRPPGSKKKNKIKQQDVNTVLPDADGNVKEGLSLDENSQAKEEEAASLDSESDLTGKLVIDDTFRSEVDCVKETVKSILSAANDNQGSAVRKSTRLRKRKIHPDAVTEEPRKKRIKLSVDAPQKEQEVLPDKNKKKRKADIMEEVHDKSFSDKLPKSKKAKMDVEQKNSTGLVHEESPEDTNTAAVKVSPKSSKEKFSKTVTGKNLSLTSPPKKGLIKEETKLTRSRKSQPRKCVRYAELNNSENSENESEEKAETQEELPADSSAASKDNKSDEDDGNGKLTDCHPDVPVADAISNCISTKKLAASGWKTSKRIMKRYFDKKPAGKCIRKGSLSDTSKKDLDKKSEDESAIPKTSPAYMKKARLKAIPLRKALLQKKVQKKLLVEKKFAKSEIHGDISAMNETPRTKRKSAIRAQELLNSWNEKDAKVASSSEPVKDDDANYVPPDSPESNNNPTPQIHLKKAVDVEGELSGLKQYYTIPKKIKSAPPSKKLIASWIDKINSNGTVACSRKNCGKEFSTKGGMIYHFQNSCVQHRWLCNVCNLAVLPYDNKMLSHMKKKHRELFGPKLPYRREISSFHDLCEGIALPSYKTEDLFPELRPKAKMWEKIDMRLLQDYIPSMKSSMKLTLRTLQNDTDLQSFSLLPFEVCKENAGSRSSTFYTGGQVWCSAWCPTTDDKESNQYVILATGFSTESEHSTSAEGKGLLQLWDFGNLQDTVIKAQPSLKIAIPLDCGKIWQISWCPDCWEDPSKENEEGILLRLGVVALACADSFIRIFSIPHPETLGADSGDVPLYNVQPMALLKPMFGEPSITALFAMCTTLCWQSSNSKTRSVVGGFSNGLVHLWQIPQAPGLLLERTDSQDIISPYTTFQAHSGGVTSAEFSPFSEGRYLATGGIDKSLKVWDLWEPYQGMPIMNLKKGVTKIIEWPSLWSGIFLGLDDGLISKTTSCYQDLLLLKKNRTTSWTNSTGMSFSISSHMVMAATGDYAGELTVSALNKIYLDHSRPLQLQYSLFKTSLRTVQQANMTAESPSESPVENGASEIDGALVSTTRSEDIPSAISIPGSESCDKPKPAYEVLFIDLQNEVIKPSEKDTKKMNDLMADAPDPITFDGFYPVSVNSVCWNPNQGSHHWLFTANQSGIGRVFYIPNKKPKQS